MNEGNRHKGESRSKLVMMKRQNEGDGGMREGGDITGR